jgi:hypothetical protein
MNVAPAPPRRVERPTSFDTPHRSFLQPDSRGWLFARRGPGFEVAVFKTVFKTVAMKVRFGENGSALPLALVVIVLCCVSVFGIGRLGESALMKGQAQIAADAAALAGARAGSGEAAALSSANGAHLVSLSSSSTPDWVDVDVIVEIGGLRASASARYVPPTTLPPTTTTTTTTTMVPDSTVPDAPPGSAVTPSF